MGLIKGLTLIYWFCRLAIRDYYMLWPYDSYSCIIGGVPTPVPTIKIQISNHGHDYWFDFFGKTLIKLILN